jgi:hypothetical protein
MPRSKQAIAEDLAKRLPAPFNDVYFEWDASDQHIALEYVGLAERLIECGAIEPRMAEKARKGEPKPRRDSSDHRFYREVRISKEPLCRVLRVVRYIADSKLAELLPGAPRGLRMKRLDWLDARPGTIHVARGKGQLGREVNTIAAGRREDLIAAGFPASCFLSKLLSRSGRDRVYGNLAPFENASADVRMLMRGYFEINIWHAPGNGLPGANINSRPPPARSSLRIVVNNEFAGGCTA